MAVFSLTTVSLSDNKVVAVINDVIDVDKTDATDDPRSVFKIGTLSNIS
jgi:hypothetical protein